MNCWETVLAIGKYLIRTKCEIIQKNGVRTKNNENQHKYMTKCNLFCVY